MESLVCACNLFPPFFLVHIINVANNEHQVLTYHSNVLPPAPTPKPTPATTPPTAPTPKPTSCPIAKCPNGTCVSNLLSCYSTQLQQGCPSLTPFFCSATNTCLNSTSACRAASPTCPPGGVLCWNGKCVSSASLCDPVSSCPSGQIRCVDGSCVSSATGCSSTASPTCLAPNVTCPDSACTTNVTLCAPYFGCAVGQLRCADGSCVTNASKCACATAGSVRCYDGTCAIPPAICPPDPSQLKVS
jgi:hypothetical protein